MAVSERRVLPRYYFVTLVDVSVPGFSDSLWGAVANISRTGIALYIRQQLKPGSAVTIRFRFQGEGGREVSETITAKLVWQRGETAGLEFEPPMLANSPASKKAPHLADYLSKKEATKG